MKASKTTKPVPKAVKDLPAEKPETVKGGTVSDGGTPGAIIDDGKQDYERYYFRVIAKNGW